MATSTAQKTKTSNKTVEDLDFSVSTVTVDMNKNEVMTYRETFFIGLTADCPMQYVTIPGCVLTKFCEPIKGYTSDGEPSRIPQRGMMLDFTYEEKLLIEKSILSRGLKFTSPDKKMARDFKLPCKFEEQRWSNIIHPLGYYVYFVQLKVLQKEKVFDHRSTEQTAYKVPTVITRPKEMGSGWEESVVPDPKLQKNEEFFTFKMSEK